jgi:hypothetical protein
MQMQLRDVVELFIAVVPLLPLGSGRASEKLLASGVTLSDRDRERIASNADYVNLFASGVVALVVLIASLDKTVRSWRDVAGWAVAIGGAAFAILCYNLGTEGYYYRTPRVKMMLAFVPALIIGCKIFIVPEAEPVIKNPPVDPLRTAMVGVGVAPNRDRIMSITIECIPRKQINHGELRSVGGVGIARPDVISEMLPRQLPGAMKNDLIAMRIRRQKLIKPNSARRYCS